MNLTRASLGIVAFTAAGVLALACGGDDSSDPIDTPDGAADGAPAKDGGIASDSSAPDTSVVDAADAADANLGKNLDGGACDGGAVTVTAVTPKFGTTTERTPLTISGSGFVATPKIYLRAGGVLTPVTSVAFVSSTSLTGLAPLGLAAVDYDVIVVDPSDCASVFAGAFKVVTDPAPVVLGVTPASGTTQTDVDVTVTGCNFPADATLATVSASLTELAQLVKTAPVAGAGDARCNGGPLYTMTGTLQTKTKAMTVGAYLVRVKNPTSGTYGDYASFVVNNPTGNLAAGGWKAGPALVTARRSLGLVSGRVNDASRFLYAVGGETAAGAALKTVEIAPVDRFGQLGGWFVEKHQLGVARSGLSVVRQDEYLYAVGGTSSTNGTGGAAPAGVPLSSIERAVILEPSGAPHLTDHREQRLWLRARGRQCAGLCRHERSVAAGGRHRDDAVVPVELGKRGRQPAHGARSPRRSVGERVLLRRGRHDERRGRARECLADPALTFGELPQAPFEVVAMTTIPGTFHRPSTALAMHAFLERAHVPGEELNESKTADSDGHRLRREQPPRHRACAATDLPRHRAVGRP